MKAIIHIATFACALFILRLAPVTTAGAGEFGAAATAFEDDVATRIETLERRLLNQGLEIDAIKRVIEALTLPPEPPPPTPPPTPPPAPRSLAPSDDSYIRGGEFAGFAWGEQVRLEVKLPPANRGDFARRALLRFDLGAVTQPVTSARLRLYAIRAQSNTPLSVYPIPADWREATATFDDLAVDAARLPAALDSVAPQQDAWVEWDVTPWVNANLGRPVGFMIAADVLANADVTMLRSKENGRTRPELVLSWGGQSSNGTNRAPFDLWLCTTTEKGTPDLGNCDEGSAS